jgi:type III restriction enzyme
MSSTIDQLIINSPYEEPARYWSYDRETRTFSLKAGRRPAGYVRASESSKAFDDPGVFVPLELPEMIRPRVKEWRERGYPGTTGITRRLLEHWRDTEARDNRFFFCQLEAIETLIWLAEAPPASRQGITIPGDGGDFTRLCSKMATGRLLVLEVKAEDSQQNQTKRNFLAEWVKAVNAHGGFGEWTWDLSRKPKDVAGILEKHNAG